MGLAEGDEVDSQLSEGDRREGLFRELTGQRLLPAVERLLREKPWGVITVEELASEAGISRTLFYNHFTDKTDLLRALTTDVLDRLAHAGRVVWMLPPDAGKQYYREAWAYLVEEGLRHAQLLEAVADAARTDAAARLMLRDRVNEGARNIEKHIRAAQVAGVHRSDVDAAHTALCLAWMIEWGLTRMGPSGFDVDRLITAMTDVYWKATH